MTPRLAKVKWFKQESAHRQTDGHYQTYYRPCYVVDNNITDSWQFSVAVMSFVARTKLLDIKPGYYWNG